MMTAEEFDRELPAVLEKMKSIMTAKGTDYAGQADRFANFRLCERMGIPAWKGAVIRLSDKMSRIFNFCKAEDFAVKDESIEDTLLDAANYAILILFMYRDWKKEGTTKTFKAPSLGALGPLFNENPFDAPSVLEEL